MEAPAEPLPFDWRSIEPIMTELRTPDPGWWERLAVIAAPTLLVSGSPASHVSRTPGTASTGSNRTNSGLS